MAQQPKPDIEMARVVTFFDPDDYQLEQLQEVLMVVVALDRGDFIYAEAPYEQ